MISKELKIAAKEINKIFEFVSEEDLEKIPKELQEFFLEIEDKNYNPTIDFQKSLEEQHLKKKTKDILVFLYVNYWCPKEEKEEVKKILAKNYEKKQLELREKYNPEDIFKRKNKENTVKEMQIIEYKETYIRRILNKLRLLFRKKL